MSIVSIYEIGIIHKTPLVQYAIKRLLKQRKFVYKNNEQVIDFGELILECREISREQEKRGVTNNE